MAAHTCNTCGGTSTPMVGNGVGGTGLGGAAAGLCCCKLCRNSASRLSCSCSCSRISCSFNCVRDVGVAVLNVGGLKNRYFVHVRLYPASRLTSRRGVLSRFIFALSLSERVNEFRRNCKYHLYRRYDPTSYYSSARPENFLPEIQEV